MPRSRPNLRILHDLQPRWEGRTVLRLTGLLLTLLASLLVVFQPVALQKVELLLYDIMVAGRATAPRSAAPLLVRIDEASLASVGQWPWPRYRMAALVDKLHELGASVVVLDLLMAEADRTSPEVIEAERRRDLGATAAPATPADHNTERLARSLRQGASAIGYYLDFNGPGVAAPGRAAPALPAGTVVIRAGGADPWRAPVAAGAIRSQAALTEAASAEGFTNALEDIDGTLRRVPLLLPAAGAPAAGAPAAGAPAAAGDRPSLALAALLLASKQRQLRLLEAGGESALRWGEHSIPLDAAGNLLLDFRSEGHAHLSAGAVLEGKTAPGSLQGKIVLVGTWATGLGDWHRTPSGRLLNGLDIHATIIDNILSDTYVSRPDWARGAELLAVLAAGALCTLLLSQAGYPAALVAMLAGSGGLYLGARQLLVAQGLHLSPLVPMLALVLITSVLGLLRVGIEMRKVRARTRDLFEAQDEIIFSLSVLAESRDKDTGRHILRTQRYVELLARQLASTPQYAHLSASDIELFAKSAPLHDIGKVGIPDSILQKPGKLTEQEYAIMKTHPLIGAETIARIMESTGQPEKQHFLKYAREMIEAHHERWDGTGYPHQLKGQAIPLAGRLMALADVYDALISKRVYKAAFSHPEVCDYIVENAGSQFDPDLVKAFLARNEEFFRIAQQYADVGEAAPQ